MNSSHHNFARQTGFSLMEAVVVIAISGIIVAAVALFIRAPVTGYVDTALRAELTDIADTALRRIGRDLRTALPNSIRISPPGLGACTGSNVCYLEYLEVRTGGRYRAATSGGSTSPACPSDDPRVTDNDILSFYASPSVSTDTCFKTLGNIPNLAQIVNGSDFVVVFNLGILGASAYESPNTNKSLISGTSTSGNEDRIAFTAQTFRLPSPGNRFVVITGPVSYVCDPVGGTLTRYSGYAIAASQPTPPAGGSNALLASRVSACSFTYNAAVVAQRDGLVTMSLSVTEVNSQGKNETVTLYEAAHVSNVP